MTGNSFSVFDRAGAFIGTVRVRADGRAEAILPRGLELGRFNSPDAAVRAVHAADQAAKAGVVDRAGAVDCLAEIAVAHSFGAIDVALAEAFNSRVPDAYHKAASYDEEEAA